jgi:GH25 family lysozyme M1 (1,4-beta-N-acetylmuramidase)
VNTPTEAPAAMPEELRLYDPHFDVSSVFDLVATLEDLAAAPAIVSAQGLDVSNFQGRFPWTAVKNAYSALAFGIYKMTEGTNFLDADANWNATQIKANHLQHGAYHFGHPSLSAITQAQYFVAQHRTIGLANTDMLWLDFEDTDGLGPLACSAWANLFMNELHTLCPQNPMGVYTYVNFISEGNCAGLGKWPLWLSYPNLSSPTPPPPWHNWVFWQWGTRNGIDADAFNGTAAGLNSWIASYAPVPPTPAPATPQVITADGVHSFGSLVAKHGTTVDRSLWLMARDTANDGGNFGGFQRALIDKSTLAKLVPAGGTRLWVG